MRYLKPFVCLTIPMVVICAAVSAYGPPPPARDDEADAVGYYLDDDQRVDVSILRDRIGLVAEKNVRLDALQKFVDDPDWKVEQPSRAGITILRTAGPREPHELEKMVRRLTERNAKLKADRPLQSAGLLVLTDGARIPMLLTEEFVVEFKDDVSAEYIAELNRKYKVEVVRKSEFNKHQFVLRSTAESNLSFLEAPIRYYETGKVEFAHPDFVRPIARRWRIPNDPLFGKQWHHENTRQNSGTLDADIDTPLAWDITLGSKDRVIAVIDCGFEITHPDLVDNIWLNQREIPAGLAAHLTDIDGDGLISFRDLNDPANAGHVTDVNGNGRIDGEDLLGDVRWANRADDDGNGYPDDLLGWNFERHHNNDVRPAAGDDHGTQVAGCVGARGNNWIGVSGTCPVCRLMLIKIPVIASGSALAHAFDYARGMGAEIITNSWGYSQRDGSPARPPRVLVRAIDHAATRGRGGLGCVVFFAMPNEFVDLCGGRSPDVSALTDVIAVSAASNRDCFDHTGFGNCMDVLAPTRRPVSTDEPDPPPQCGTLGIMTTTLEIHHAYNANCDGTSFAAPITAGIAGLALEVAPELTRLQIQRLIQDTTDRIEDSSGFYSMVTGFSSPASGVATHGYGRVNAFEAVRVVAPTARGGRGRVDIMLRDNRLDWGNTEQPSSTRFEPVRDFIPYWESADIKVDAPPFQNRPTSSRQFDAFTDEAPLAASTNRVYVRVRNRGPSCADSVTLKLHWAFAGTALPALPADFWSAFPSDSSDTSHWHPLGQQTLTDLEYCGTSVAGRGRADVAQIAAFDFKAPAVDPTKPEPQHYCLFCIADSPQDPVSAATRSTLNPDYITPRDNNVTLRNLVLQSPERDGNSRGRFYVRNPYERLLKTKIEVKAPNGWKTRLDQGELGQELILKPGEERLLELNFSHPDLTSMAEILVMQNDLEEEQPLMIGGLTLRVAPAASDTPPEK